MNRINPRHSVALVQSVYNLGRVLSEGLGLRPTQEEEEDLSRSFFLLVLTAIPDSVSGNTWIYYLCKAIHFNSQLISSTSTAPALQLCCLSFNHFEQQPFPFLSFPFHSSHVLPVFLWLLFPSEDGHKGDVSHAITFRCTRAFRKLAGAAERVGVSWKTMCALLVRPETILYN